MISKIGRLNIITVFTILVPYVLYLYGVILHH